jgi:4-carboxymuconolactone decarboxylase
LAWSGALDDRHGQVPDLARVVGLHDVPILDIDGDPCRTARALVHDDPMAPRIPPLPAEGRDPKTAELLDGLKGFNGTELNIFATLAHHPRLLKRWSAFGGVLLYGGALPARERELLILRSGYLCQAPYEWGQHVTIGLASGLTDDEVARVAEGPTADGWSDDDALLLRAADELHADSRIGDATWAPLAARWDAQQLIEVCMVVGQYHLVAMTLNSLGVEPESDDFPVLPAFPGHAGRAAAPTPGGSVARPDADG